MGFSKIISGVFKSPRRAMFALSGFFSIITTAIASVFVFYPIPGSKLPVSPLTQDIDSMQLVDGAVSLTAPDVYDVKGALTPKQTSILMNDAVKNPHSFTEYTDQLPKFISDVQSQSNNIGSLLINFDNRILDTGKDIGLENLLAMGGSNALKLDMDNFNTARDFVFQASKEDFNPLQFCPDGQQYTDLDGLLNDPEAVKVAAKNIATFVQERTLVNYTHLGRNLGFHGTDAQVAEHVRQQLDQAYQTIKDSSNDPANSMLLQWKHSLQQQQQDLKTMSRALQTDTTVTHGGNIIDSVKHTAENVSSTVGHVMNEAIHLLSNTWVQAGFGVFASVGVAVHGKKIYQSFQEEKNKLPTNASVKEIAGATLKATFGTRSKAITTLQCLACSLGVVGTVATITAASVPSAVPLISSAGGALGAAQVAKACLNIGAIGLSAPDMKMKLDGLIKKFWVNNCK